MKEVSAGRSDVATTPKGPHSEITLGTMATQDASAVAITGGTVKGLPDPTSDQDAATKAYVDSHSGSTDDILPDAGAILVKFQTIGTPATPPAGKARVYVDETSLNLSVVDQDGTVKHGVQTKAESTHLFLTGIDDDGTVHSAHPASTDLSDATAAGVALVSAADAAAQRTALGLGPLATASSMTVVGDLYGSSTGSTLTAHVANNAVTYQKLQEASANVLLGHGPGGAVYLSTLSTPVSAGTSPEFMGVGDNTMTGSTRGYIPPACTLTLLEVGPQGGGSPSVDTTVATYKNGVATAATLVQEAGNTNASDKFPADFGTITFNGTTDTLDIVVTPSAGGGGAWNVLVTVGTDTTGAPGDVEEIPCTDAGRAIIAAADDAAQRAALGLGSLATASSVASTDISDATTAGKAMLTAADAKAQATLLGEGIVSWRRNEAHNNTTVPPSGSWTPDGYTADTLVINFDPGGSYQCRG